MNEDLKVKEGEKKMIRNKIVKNLRVKEGVNNIKTDKEVKKLFYKKML